MLRIVGVAPGVDGLVGVADYADVEVNAGELLGDGVLGDVGVLEFVDHKVDEAVLVFFGDVGLALEELVCFEEEVVEVHGGALAQQVVVALVGADDDFFPVTAGMRG